MLSKCRGLAQLVFALIVVTLSCSCESGSAAQGARDCDSAQNTRSIPSSNGKLEALVYYQACAGGFGSGSEMYSIRLRRSDRGASDEGTTVFEVQQYLPYVAWSDDTRLIITINKVSNISPERSEDR